MLWLLSDCSKWPCYKTYSGADYHGLAQAMLLYDSTEVSPLVIAKYQRTKLLYKYLLKNKIKKKKPYCAVKPVLKLKRENGSFTFYTDYTANLKIPIAIAMFRWKITFLGNSIVAVSVLYPFTPAQKHLVSQLLSLKSRDLPWSKQQDDISTEVLECDCATKMGTGLLGRALPSVSGF